MVYVPSSEAADGLARVIYQAKDGGSSKTFLALDWLAQLVSVLYGPYDGTTSIMIEYSPVFKDAEVSGADETGSWNINDHEMEYGYLDRQGREVISTYLDLDEAGINATYFLSEKFTKEDAKEFTAFLVNELY